MSIRLTALVTLAGLILVASPSRAQSPALRSEIERRTAAVLPKVVAWRRDIHEHPELSGEEVRTSKLVADHLKALGLEVKTNVGGYGVIGILRGGKPGPVVALRADMDALPVEEQVDLPFKSHVKTTYGGQNVGVMHACGHDNHTAILMGVAELLTEMKDQLPGTVKFIFQPAEEMKLDGTGGADPMIKAGALENPKVDAIFGLHVVPGALGEIRYRSGPTMAAANSYSIVVHGKQTHGARPWSGVDPIVVSSQIIGVLQTIVSRQVDIGALPAVVTVGVIQGGVRNNIIPDSVVMLGTIRTFSHEQRAQVFAAVKRTAEQIAAASGATATVKIDSGYPVTANNPALTAQMIPTLVWAAGPAGTRVEPLVLGAEDFSFFQEKIPGLFVFLGVTPKGQDPEKVAVNHSPLFFADEAALPNGIRAMAGLAVDYLASGKVQH